MKDNKQSGSDCLPNPGAKLPPIPSADTPGYEPIRAMLSARDGAILDATQVDSLVVSGCLVFGPLDKHRVSGDTEEGNDDGTVRATGTSG